MALVCTPLDRGLVHGEGGYRIVAFGHAPIIRCLELLPQGTIPDLSPRSPVRKKVSQDDAGKPAPSVSP
jgi:hypothetical protein